MENMALSHFAASLQSQSAPLDYDLANGMAEVASRDLPSVNKFLGTKFSDSATAKESLVSLYDQYIIARVHNSMAEDSYLLSEQKKQKLTNHVAKFSQIDQADAGRLYLDSVAGDELPIARMQQEFYFS